MKWSVESLPEVEKDIEQLDKSQRDQVFKLIDRVSRNPLPASEGGYGKPLSGDLAGCLKIKLRAAGLRAVYRLQRIETTMLVVVVGVRADEEVYDLAEKRIRKYGLDS